MNFPFGSRVYRLRPVPEPSRYNPDEMVEGDWATAQILPINRAFVAQSSTSLRSTATREQALEGKSLFDPVNADIRKGDRIFAGTFTPPLPAGADRIPAGTALDGAVYTIDGIPPTPDTNPFTGWTPPREIPLRRYED